MINWQKYHPYFKPSEFACKETGKHGIKAEFLDRLLALRLAWGRPMIITSGYRAPEHSRERKKERPGPHTTGLSCDVAIGPGADVWDFVRLAMDHGFTGIGISQKVGQPRFVHIDLLEKRMWSY
ncbi:MAG: D-Ala-D-Ala carboxypeptidase family metallohydrolase [Alishewanella aestuarii]